MTEEDIKRANQFFPDMNIDDPIKCKDCNWSGQIRDLKVAYSVSKRPRLFMCPNDTCNKAIINTTPHTW